MEAVIRFDTQGTPLAVRYQGTIWIVDPESLVRQRSLWSVREVVANDRRGDPPQWTQWQLRVRNSSTLAFATMDLAFDEQSGTWHLTRLVPGVSQTPQ